MTVAASAMYPPEVSSATCAGGSVDYVAMRRALSGSAPYPTRHNLGTTRMSARPEDGIANEFGRAPQRWADRLLVPD